MIKLEFKGWFQCRLATDPDPYDERRGVTGYAHAYAGEPDLDRIIHFQRPEYVRFESPEVGVLVRKVMINNALVEDHPLLGAKLTLLDDPKFQGRNGVIADDGKEPILPFKVRIAGAGIVIERGVAPVDQEFPYREFFAIGSEFGAPVAAKVSAETGIQDLSSVWRYRLGVLKKRALKATEEEKVALDERIAMLTRWLAVAHNPSRFFHFRMLYDYVLRSKAVVNGWPSKIQPTPHTDADWRMAFWLGGWDADTLCGFCKGVLEVPTELSSHSALAGVRSNDRERLLSVRDNEDTVAAALRGER